jgi:hypothetical protein
VVLVEEVAVVAAATVSNEVNLYEKEAEPVEAPVAAAAAEEVEFRDTVADGVVAYNEMLVAEEVCNETPVEEDPTRA